MFSPLQGLRFSRLSSECTQEVVPMKEYDADPDGEGRPLRCCEEWFVSRLCQSSLGVGDPRALLDTTVMDYLLSLLVEDDASDEECLAALSAYLGLEDDDTSPASSPPPLKEEAVHRTRAELRAIVVQHQQQQQAAREPPTPAAAAGAASAARLKDRAGEEAAGEEECCSSGRGPATRNEESAAAGPEEESLSFLRSLVPDVPAELVAFVLHVDCCGDRAAAAERLVAGASPQGIHEWAQRKARWEEAVRAEEAQAQESARRLKEAICRRFDMQQNGPGPAASSSLMQSVTAKGLSGNNNKDDDQQKKRVMYRDGVPVVVRGKDKFIVEDLTPQWDGGSRGRIKTKGKRGPGWRG